MAALPVPRRPRHAERHRPDLDGPLFFTQMPDPIWEDASVSGTDVRVLGWLVRRMRLMPGLCPTLKQVASALHLSVSTIRRSLAALERAGYLTRESVSTGGRLNARVAYSLRTPRPELAPQPRTDPQLPLFPAQDPVPEMCSLVAKQAPELVVTGAPEVVTGDHFERHPCASPPIRFERDRERQTDESAVRPSVSLAEGEGEPEDQGDEDLVQALIDLATGMWPEDATAGKVRRVIELYGLDAVEVCLDRAQARQPGPPDTWAWVPATLGAWKAEGEQWSSTSRASSPKSAALPPRQNYNPAPPPDPEAERRDRDRDQALRDAWERLPEVERAEIRATVLDEHPIPMALKYREKLIEALCLAELRHRLVESPSAAHENPAAGSHGNVPPPPVPEQPRDDRPTESYPEPRFRTSAGSPSPAAHPAPRVSNPPVSVPPSGGASPSPSPSPSRRVDRASVPFAAPPRPAPGPPAAAEVVSDAAPRRTPWWTPERPRRC